MDFYGADSTSYDQEIFGFWSLGDEVMKIQKYYIIFVYILQGKMGKTERK